MFNYFFVNITREKAADLLNTYVSPCQFYHHNRQGSKDWVVDTVPAVNHRAQTRIGLADSLDESVITFLLLKA